MGIGIDVDNTIRVMVIAGCLLNAFMAKDGFAISKRDQIILICALMLTVIADTFMVILGMNIAGILVFCGVQAAHNYRFTNKNRVIAQGVMGIGAFGVAYLSGLPLLMALGAAYAVFLLFSVTGAFMAYQKYPAPNNIMIILGMLLFMACDIFVGLYNLPIEALQAPAAREFIQRGIWIFYFPSQAILSSTARKLKNYKDDDEKWQGPPKARRM
ncbi:MAG: hypothetical protein FWE24_08630 [Defluviitaleaceae bacterium]|nr:hypothetical protein [Defluviitaleaceae bacterium]